MNIIDIERKLHEKVDKWEFHQLQTENRELKGHIHELEKNISRLENISDNRYYALHVFFDLLLEHPQFFELQSQIHEVKQNL